MDFLTDPEEFRRHNARIQELLDLERKLPEQVFRRPLGNFIFLNFDEVFWGFDLECLKSFARAEETFFVTVVDPDPQSYYRKHFNIYPTIAMGPDVDLNAYRKILARPLSEDNSETLADAAGVEVLYSFGHDWAIYGDRDFELAIAAFGDSDLAATFRSVHSADKLLTPEQALAHLVDTGLFGVDRRVPPSVRRKLLENYQ